MTPLVELLNLPSSGRSMIARLRTIFAPRRGSKPTERKSSVQPVAINQPLKAPSLTKHDGIRLNTTDGKLHTCKVNRSSLRVIKCASFPCSSSRTKSYGLIESKRHT